MMRRFISAMLVAACAGAYVAAAERATLILTNGERKSGELVFHGGNAANFIDGDLNLGNNGKEEPIHIEQVAVIDVAGGTPSTAELSRVPATATPCFVRCAISKSAIRSRSRPSIERTATASARRSSSALTTCTCSIPPSVRR